MLSVMCCCGVAGEWREQKGKDFNLYWVRNRKNMPVNFTINFTIFYNKF